MKYVWMTNCTWNGAQCPVIRDLQIKIKMIYYYIPITRLTKIKKTILSVIKDVKQLFVEMQNGTMTIKIVWKFLIKLNLHFHMIQ